MNHCVWIDEEGDGYAVRCIPHGYIGWASAHLCAFLIALTHDYDSGGGCI